MSLGQQSLLCPWHSVLTRFIPPLSQRGQSAQELHCGVSSHSCSTILLEKVSDGPHSFCHGFSISEFICLKVQLKCATVCAGAQAPGQQDL